MSEQPTLSSLCETGLQFYFVSDDGEPDTNYPDLIICFERIIETFEATNTCKWISINLCETLAKTRALTRKQVFVFGKFEGSAFENLKKTKALILGPRCIINCLISNSGIPNSKTPVFNVNMRDLCVCTSGMSPNEKNKLQTLVNYMGGYSEGNELTVATTHLVTNTIMSKKYEKAVLHKMQTMRPDWVYDLWELCKTSNIESNSVEMIDKYKVPIFYRLGITTTGLMSSIKQNLKNIIEQNGGRFYGYFKSELIDVMLMNRGDINSDKYKAAVKCKKLCLTPDWITNSLAKGFALPVMDYRVNDLITPPPSRIPSEIGGGSSGGSGSTKSSKNPTLKISTPTKPDQPLPINESAFNQNCTALSMILNNETINESRHISTPPAITTTTTTSVAPQVQSSTDSTLYKNILANISLRDARNAGLFLDGCNIYLCGFTSSELVKITRILGTSGASLFSEFNSKVSYVIIGSLNESEMEFLSSIHDYCTLIKVDWIFASINQKQPAPEKEFLITLNHKRNNINGGCSGGDGSKGKQFEASPASKKNIEIMSMGFRKPLAPKRLNLECGDSSAEQQIIANKKQRGEEEDLLSQYLVEAAVVSPKSKQNEKIDDVPAAMTIDKNEKNQQNPKSPQINNKLSNPNHESDYTDDYTDGWTENLDFLTGKTVVIHGFIEESFDLITKQVNAAGGKIIYNYFDNHHHHQQHQSLMVDYFIVATDILNLDNEINAKFIVNDLWLQESINDNKCVPIKYYHHPIIIKNDEQCKPLAGNMIVLTTYTGHEREYLTILATCLGADVEEKYFKAQNPILICPRPEGAKYNGAIKWHLPVGRCEWLLECLRTNEKVPMRPYLVGESVLPKDEIENELKLLETTVDSPSDIVNNDDNDKNKNKFTTPILKHNRLMDIQNSAKRNGNNSPISPADKLAEYVKELPTPKRKFIYDQLKDVNNDLTPFTKRQRLEMDTPELIKVLDDRVTPIIKAKQDEILRAKVIQKSNKTTTPFSEFKKKFWKDALGDSYEHSIYTQNSISESALIDGVNVSLNRSTSKTSNSTSTKSPVSNKSATTATTTPTTKTTPNKETTNNEHIQRFTDFIKKNRQSSSSSPGNIKEIVPPKNLDQHETPHFSDDIAETPQNYVVGWKDPLDFFDTHRFKNRNQIQHEGTPRFNISCSDLQVNETIQNQIIRLNGEICVHLSGYDRTCTHVLCQSPNRSEKIFSAIAAGRWVLSLNYIKESIVAGHFLNEELYEWGNPKAIENLPEIDDDNIKQTARAAYRWRQKIQSKFLKERNRPGPSNRQSAILDNPDAYGAFEGFKVILHMMKKASFIKLLEAGGGIVLELSEPYAQHGSDLLSNATHCILDTKCKLNETDRTIFEKNNVPCVNISFLQAYITADTIPNVENFLC